jgi:ATP-binding cassette subfamily B multidrug efflux pump
MPVAVEGLLFISIALLLPLSVAGAVQPLIIGQAISLIRNEEQVWFFLKDESLADGLNILIGLLLLTIAIRLAFVSIQGFVVAKLGQQITTWIRNDLFDHVTSLAAVF